MAWGVLTSHTRAHGQPPREQWENDAALTEDFRKALNLRYALMPYIYAHAKNSSARGFPMSRHCSLNIQTIRARGTSMTSTCLDRSLVAPMFDGSGRRRVYLPPVTRAPANGNTAGGAAPAQWTP